MNKLKIKYCIYCLADILIIKAPIDFIIFVGFSLKICYLINVQLFDKLFLC